jgi:SET domain-containing protein
MKADINKINASESDYLYTNPSQITNSGKGLFTAITIYKDEIIAIYKGKILTKSEAKTKAEKGKDKYFINLLDGTILDSMPIKCFAKYANDATGFSKSDFKNNAKIGLDENENVCLIATRKIKQGEEVFCNYGKRYWNKHK